jgi:hypothetical protein
MGFHINSVMTPAAAAATIDIDHHIHGVQRH